LKSKKNIVQSNARLLAALNQDFSAKEQAAFYKSNSNHIPQPLNSKIENNVLLPTSISA